MPSLDYKSGDLVIAMEPGKPYIECEVVKSTEDYSWEQQLYLKCLDKNSRRMYENGGKFWLPSRWCRKKENGN